MSYDHVYVKHDCLFKSWRKKIDHIEVSSRGKGWFNSEQKINPDDIHVEWDGRFFYVSGVEALDGDSVYLDIYGEETTDDMNGYYLVNLSEDYKHSRGDSELHW